MLHFSHSLIFLKKSCILVRYSEPFQIPKMKLFVKIVYGFQRLTTSAKELLPLRIIIGKSNINSIRNKFDTIFSIFKQKIDILLVSESKIDDTFSLALCRRLLYTLQT